MARAVGSGTRDAWRVGECAYFEYHCCRSHDSDDAELWYRSHQTVTVCGAGNDLYERVDGYDTLDSRGEIGSPRLYRVTFSDGLVWDVFEDELLTSPSFFNPKLGAGERLKMHKREVNAAIAKAEGQS